MKIIFLKKSLKLKPASGGEALQKTDELAWSSGAPLTSEEKNFPFHIMVRKSENNVEHLRSGGAPSEGWRVYASILIAY